MFWTGTALVVLRVLSWSTCSCPLLLLTPADRSTKQCSRSLFPEDCSIFFVHGSGLCTWILTWFTSHTCAAHFNRETSAYLQSGLGFRSNFFQPTRELFLYLLIYLSILHPIAVVLFLIPFDFKNILIASLAVEIYVGQIYLRRGLFCKGRFMQIC